MLQTSRTQHVIHASPAGTILGANPAAAALVRRTPDEMVGLDLFDLLPESDARALRERMASPGRDTAERFLLNFVDGSGVPVTLECCLEVHGQDLVLVGEPTGAQNVRLQTEMVGLNNELALIARESSRQSRELAAAKAELARALEVLQSSYGHMHKAQEVLPLCMTCERVKSSEHGWQGVAAYLKDNATFLTHGYCPDCAAKFRKQWDL